MKNMITQTKEQYTSPMCEELEIKLEGVMAVSPTYTNPFNPEKPL